MSNLQVANTIAQQIGHRALAMMGARDLIGSDDSLTFKIGRNPQGVSHVRITLDPSDTYTVEFSRRRMERSTLRLTVKVMASYSGVYADNLHMVLESGIGLYTSL